MNVAHKVDQAERLRNQIGDLERRRGLAEQVLKDAITNYNAQIFKLQGRLEAMGVPSGLQPPCIPVALRLVQDVPEET